MKQNAVSAVYKNLSKNPKGLGFQPEKWEETAFELVLKKL